MNIVLRYLAISAGLAFLWAGWWVWRQWARDLKRHRRFTRCLPAIEEARWRVRNAGRYTVSE